MINNKPNAPKNKDGKARYRQGLYIPTNTDKVLKLNENGGIYYRSNYELRVYKWLDHCSKVIKWGAEAFAIPYVIEKVDENGVLKSSQHKYYPDCYYEILQDDGSIRKVLMEVKPYNETMEPKIPTSATKKQLENWEYAMTLYSRNLFKWDAALKYCENRDIKFVIMTEKYLNNMK